MLHGLIAPLMNSPARTYPACSSQTCPGMRFGTFQGHRHATHGMRACIFRILRSPASHRSLDSLHMSFCSHVYHTLHMHISTRFTQCMHSNANTHRRQHLKASCKVHDEYDSVMHLDAPAAAPRAPAQGRQAMCVHVPLFSSPVCACASLRVCACVFEPFTFP